jgi:hypothetical protein
VSACLRACVPACLTYLRFDLFTAIFTVTQDVSSLAKFKYLRYVDLSDNYIEDITPLNALEELCTFHTSWTHQSFVLPTSLITHFVKLLCRSLAGCCVLLRPPSNCYCLVMCQVYNSVAYHLFGGRLRGRLCVLSIQVSWMSQTTDSNPSSSSHKSAHCHLPSTHLVRQDWHDVDLYMLMSP